MLHGNITKRWCSSGKNRRGILRQGDADLFTNAVDESVEEHLPEASLDTSRNLWAGSTVTSCIFVLLDCIPVSVDNFGENTISADEVFAFTNSRYFFL